MQLLKRLSDLALHDRAKNVATHLLTSASATPWHRKAACEYLANDSFEPAIRQLLEKMAQSDPSDVVKDAAFNGLTSRSIGLTDNKN
jgi:hypothetical protein